MYQEPHGTVSRPPRPRRAMAMARSVAHLFFLLLLVSTAPAVRTISDAAAGGNLQEACNKTLFPKVCLQALKDNPECQSGPVTPRRLAELLVYVSAEVGMTVAAFAHHELNAIRDDVLYRCLDTCSEDIEEAVAHLSALSRDFSDAKFLEVKSWLSSTLGGTSTCEDACKDAPVSDIKNACITKSFEFEKLLRVTLDLITEASGSMSAEVALPPSAASGASAPTYGAPAPGGGAPAYGASGSPAPTPGKSTASDA
ncbi:pectinesterase inhibitor-like [Miscanthus floridulus]|uniref:pectinesterase inhibitor-like n=1 Tax=Miscanthus floridulus TaxID=154761 RepID=UPI003457BEB8